MYTKEQASKIKQEFWTTFGRYMQPILSADGEKINWVNYKTGEKNIRFKIHTDKRDVTIAIEINHDDIELQHLYYAQMLALKNILHETLHEEWIWSKDVINAEGKQVCLIYTEFENVSIFNKNNWPEIISFFKPRMLALDEWWSMAKFQFAALR